MNTEDNNKTSLPTWALLAIGSLTLLWLSRMNFQGVVFPVERPRITLPFGATSYPYSPGNPHLALDIAPWSGSTGRPVVAAVAGRVTHAEFDDGLGNYVVTEVSLPFEVWARDLTGLVRTIRPGEHFHLLYGHMSELNVREGDRVRAGEKIGDIGSTGYSNGPHVHFEMRLGTYASRDVVNPLDMLSASIVGLKDEVVYA